jgi:S1-C subfamily serine protease
MRLFVSFALVALLVMVGSAARAQDEPKGVIGVKLKIDDGKIVVDEPIKDGPADKAGIKANDVILKVDDFKVKEKAEDEDLAELRKEVTKHNPGDKIKVTVKRGDKEMTIEVTVGKPGEVFKDKDKE